MKKLALILAWLWVSIPLSWGVYQSVQKSMPLFESQPQSSTTDMAGSNRLNEGVDPTIHMADRSTQ
jgi:hypothetical protein